jgi:hypothetical protein
MPPWNQLPDFPCVLHYNTKQNIGSRIFLVFSSLYGSDYHGCGEVCQAQDVLLQSQLKEQHRLTPVWLVFIKKAGAQFSDSIF